MKEGETWINTEIVDKHPDKESSVGFLYTVQNKKNNKIYYGIKEFWETRKLKPLKGRKNKRHKRYESDWKTYKTSNTFLKEELTNNPDDYDCGIIEMCDSITKMKAREAFLQLSCYINGDWDKCYNEMINLRLRIRK